MFPLSNHTNTIIRITFIFKNYLLKAHEFKSQTLIYRCHRQTISETPILKISLMSTGLWHPFNFPIRKRNPALQLKTHVIIRLLKAVSFFPFVRIEGINQNSDWASSGFESFGGASNWRAAPIIMSSRHKTKF